ncbi:MAG: hypothetical protein LC659_00260, partial [Myxococcales bacterium]|nr:hypothetical protein [Myxococcales bacterium]
MFEIAAAACMIFIVQGDGLASSSSPECGSGTTSTTGDPTPIATTFAAGSLIIPMDSCYNPDNAGNSGPENVGGSCGAGPSYTCYAGSSSGNVRL